MEKAGVIYILTNPSFPEYVKIGYADDVNKRLAQLNRSECIPFAFRVYATYEVSSRLSDLKIHEIIDRLNPDLRSIESFEGKKRVREFYAMSPEDAFELLRAIAEINGMEDKLKRHALSQEEKKDEKIANTIRKSNIDFYDLGIKQGEIFEYIHNPDIKVKVLDNRTVEYNGQPTSLSALAQKLLNRKARVQGTLHFSYNGEILTDLRNRIEKGQIESDDWKRKNWGGLKWAKLNKSY